MKLKADLFPYPVLNENLDDYINSEFKAEMTIVNQSPYNCKLNFKFTLKDSGLNDLIKNNNARYAVHVEGVNSSYRKLFKIPIFDNEIDIDLNVDEASDRVQINCLIIANNDVHMYRNSNFNPEYYDKYYSIKDIKKGDILAFEDTKEIKFNFENSEKLNAKSMIKIASWDKDIMEIDTTGDYILVYLPSKDAEAYRNLSHSNVALQNLLIVSIILPTLTYTIERLGKDIEETSTEWHDIMIDLLEKNGITLDMIKNNSDKSLEYAQKLLKNPFKDAIHEFYLEEAYSED